MKIQGGVLRAPLLIALLTACILVPSVALSQTAQDFKRWKAQIAAFKQWLDSEGSKGTRAWVRIDSTHRPHRLYIGEAFYEMAHRQRIKLIETFSKYLAGHPDKYALVDIYDSQTKKHIGEFGWGGYKLY